MWSGSHPSTRERRIRTPRIWSVGTTSPPTTAVEVSDAPGLWRQPATERSSQVSIRTSAQRSASALAPSSRRLATATSTRLLSVVRSTRTLHVRTLLGTDEGLAATGWLVGLVVRPGGGGWIYASGAELGGRVVEVICYLVGQLVAHLIEGLVEGAHGQPGRLGCSLVRDGDVGEPGFERGGPFVGDVERRRGLAGVHRDAFGHEHVGVAAAHVERNAFLGSLTAQEDDPSGCPAHGDDRRSEREAVGRGRLHRQRGRLRRFARGLREPGRDGHVPRVGYRGGLDIEGRVLVPGLDPHVELSLTVLEEDRRVLALQPYRDAALRSGSAQTYLSRHALTSCKCGLVDGNRLNPDEPHTVPDQTRASRGALAPDDGGRLEGNRLELDVGDFGLQPEPHLEVPAPPEVAAREIETRGVVSCPRHSERLAVQKHQPIFSGPDEVALQRQVGQDGGDLGQALPEPGEQHVAQPLLRSLVRRGPEHALLLDRHAPFQDQRPVAEDEIPRAPQLAFSIDQGERHVQGDEAGGFAADRVRVDRRIAHHAQALGQEGRPYAGVVGQGSVRFYGPHVLDDDPLDVVARLAQLVDGLLDGGDPHQVLALVTGRVPDLAGQAEVGAEVDREVQGGVPAFVLDS